MVYTDAQIKLANKMLAKWEKNIEFINSRIAEQGNKTHGRRYSAWDIKDFQDKIDTVLANLQETKEAREIEQARLVNLTVSYSQM